MIEHTVNIFFHICDSYKQASLKAIWHFIKRDILLFPTLVFRISLSKHNATTHLSLHQDIGLDLITIGEDGPPPQIYTQTGCGKMWTVVSLLIRIVLVSTVQI